jgi:hypothetical protein
VRQSRWRSVLKSSSTGKPIINGDELEMQVVLHACASSRVTMRSVTNVIDLITLRTIEPKQFTGDGPVRSIGLCFTGGQNLICDGGIILTRIGFQLFAPTSSSLVSPAGDGSSDSIAFVPLAMPIMFGPGGIATLIGMAATVHLSRGGLETYLISFLAILATMVVTFLSLVYAGVILTKIGPKGIDAATRITGFFVSAMGMGLFFNGIVEFLQSYGFIGGRAVGP